MSAKKLQKVIMAALALTCTATAAASETYYCTVKGMSLELNQVRNPEIEEDYGETFEQNGMKRKFEITINNKDFLVRHEIPTLKGPRIQTEKYLRLPAAEDPVFGNVNPNNVTGIKLAATQILNVVTISKRKEGGHHKATIAAVGEGITNGWHLNCTK